MKNHKFWAWAAVICMVMAIYTGQQCPYSVYAVRCADVQGERSDGGVRSGELCGDCRQFLLVSRDQPEFVPVAARDSRGNLAGEFCPQP